jgi:AmmeMemoRadiSam system protein B/AmmeMemoRadiSam system protein A
MKKKWVAFLIFIILFGFNCSANGGKESQKTSEGESQKAGKEKVAGMKESSKQTDVTREAAVAGQFYPANPVELSKMIAGFFNKAKKEDIPGEIIALISPHAGYVYSGQVAAYGYKLLEGLKFDVVVVISPSHTLPFAGSSVFNGKFYKTPLGEIEIDQPTALEIASVNDYVYLSDKGHTVGGMRDEHSLEVQLPFLQTVLGKFKLVPIVMGEQDWQSCQALGEALSKGLEGKNALIVASSDLSHFHPYSQAVKLDSVVQKDVASFDPEKLFEDLQNGTCEACGGGPIIGAMLAAKKCGANKSKVLMYANSGDVTGDRAGVVGYMSAVLYRQQSSHKSGNKTEKESVKEEARVGVDLGLSDKDKKVLKDIAKKTIECKVKGTSLPEFKIDSEILKEKRGAFVTINKEGHLRGCIGYIYAMKPLYITIQEMAESAALSDPRFPPVTPDELDKLEIEISVLTPLKKMKDINEIQIGKDGLYMKRGYYSGLLLPQVAVEYNWDVNTFLEETCHKAGMRGDCWKDKDTEIYIFSADIF